MEGSNNPARSSSYSKLNDWSNNKKSPLVARRSKLSLWKRIFVVLVIVACIIFIGLGIGFGLNKIKQKSLVNVQHPFTQTFSKGAVSSQSYNCSVIGKNVLMEGGSAVDAAIATLLCEGVYSPQSCGLGGGFFMLVYSKDTSTIDVIDARETAPGRATSDLYKERNSTLFGGLAVAVPGELKGYHLAHQRYGNLNWSRLFQPAINLCREGIVVSPRLGYSINFAYKKLLLQSNLRPLFTRQDSEDLLQTGDVYYCKKLAETLEIIAEKGADELYEGELSKKMLKDLQNLGSIISEEDLKGYQAVQREPVVFKLHEDIQVHTMPPPGGGLVLGLLMQILDKIAYNVTYGIDEIDDLLWAHYFAEASKYAYAKRADIGDPNFEDMKELINSMTSLHLAEKIQSSISEDRTFGPKHYEAMFAAQQDHGTVHVSVLAPNGDAVSVTSTLNIGFGAIVMSNSTGIIFNNEMDDFSLPSKANFYGLSPSPANYIKGGKRPSSTMAPTIVLDGQGDVMYVMGGSGGSKIVSSQAYVFMMHEYRNSSIEDAIKAKRLHHQLIPNELEYEEGFDTEILESLVERGHDLKVTSNLSISSVYLLYRNAVEGNIIASADLRRSSAPSGF